MALIEQLLERDKSAAAAILVLLVVKLTFTGHALSGRRCQFKNTG